MSFGAPHLERKWTGALALVPLFVLMVFIFGGALLFAVLQSLGFAPWYGINRFPDFSFYAELWRSPRFWQSLGLTLYYAVVATAASMVLGVLLALALVKSFRLKPWVQHVYKWPLVIPYGVGIALVLLMLGNGGALSRMAAGLGWIDDPAKFPPLLNTYAGWGVIAVYVWKQVPFVAMVISALLLGRGRDKEEAALVLGANARQVFWQVTWPEILPGMYSAGFIIMAFNLGAFEAPFILGGGYPDTLPVLAWRYFQDANPERQLEAMAVVVTLILVSAALLFGAFFLMRRWRLWREGRA